MKKLLLTCGAFSLIAVVPLAQAASANYNVITTWSEPETGPNDSIFIGSFTFDDVAHTVSNLRGKLSESMTGGDVGYPADTMTWLTLGPPLGHQLQSWHDATLGGTFAATFLNTTTATFKAPTGVSNYDGWSPPGTKALPNLGNAYALIFVPNNPLAPLSQAQINLLAYADCAPGGMMGPVCMTGIAGGGTMSGYPVSQVITLAPVPEPESYAMLLAGLGLLGFITRRRRQALQ